MSGNADVAPGLHGRANRRAVLIVEDEVLVRLVAAEHLRDSGFEVLEAANAEEAVRILALHAVDAVFSDVNMPGSLNGSELAGVVRREYPRIKVLLTSALRVEDGGAGVQAIPFLAKPYTLARLTERLQQILEEE